MSKRQASKPRKPRMSKERDAVLQAKFCKSWLKSVEKTLTKMEELALAPALHGEVWRAKTGQYYTDRIRAMCDVAPKGVRKHVAGLRKRIEALPW